MYVWVAGMKTPEVDQFGILWRQFTDRRIGLETIGPSSWNDVWIYIYYFVRDVGQFKFPLC